MSSSPIPLWRHSCLSPREDLIGLQGSCASPGACDWPRPDHMPAHGGRAKRNASSFISVDLLAVEFILNRKRCQRDNRSSLRPLCVPPSVLGVKGDRGGGQAGELCSVMRWRLCLHALDHSWEDSSSFSGPSPLQDHQGGQAASLQSRLAGGLRKEEAWRTGFYLERPAHM